MAHLTDFTKTHSDAAYTQAVETANKASGHEVYYRRFSDPRVSGNRDFGCGSLFVSDRTADLSAWWDAYEAALAALPSLKDEARS